MVSTHFFVLLCSRGLGTCTIWSLYCTGAVAVDARGVNGGGRMSSSFICIFDISVRASANARLVSSTGRPSVFSSRDGRSSPATVLLARHRSSLPADFFSLGQSIAVTGRRWSVYGKRVRVPRMTFCMAIYSRIM